jgi:molecular chaperone DnaK (HSP70)
MTLALDFGTCNSVLARWNAATRQVETVKLDKLSRTYVYRPPGGEARQSSVIPSLIHYGRGGRVLAGAAVEDAGLTSARETWRWFKLDILNRNANAKIINGEQVSPMRAGEDLIGQVLLATGGAASEDLVLTMPVESFDHYGDWLRDAVLKQFRGTVRLLDEATACILGYQAHVRAGQIYLVFDFGGGTLDVSVVKIADNAAAGEPPRVLARAGEEIGGSLVDEWMLAAAREANRLSEDEVRDVNLALLKQTEAAKIALSGGAGQAEVSQFNDMTGRAIHHVFTAEGLRKVLQAERRELQGLSLYRAIARTIERALRAADVRYGAKKSDIRAVFMAGGSSLLLGVAEVVKTLFTDCAVHCDNPFEAIARGACRYAGEDINMTLVHDYVVKNWDRERKEYTWVPIVPKGTRYPTEEPVSKKYLSAASEAATTLGLIVGERSEMVRRNSRYEDVGGVLQEVSAWSATEEQVRVLTPDRRDFVHADPPCNLGDKRFVIGFGVDENRRLTVNLRDLHPNGRSFVELPNGDRVPLPVRGLPVVKL